MKNSLILMHAKGYMTKEVLKDKVKTFLLDERGAGEFDDGGTTSWGRNVAIGLGIAAVLFALVSAFAPELVNAWKGKVMEFFN